MTRTSSEAHAQVEPVSLEATRTLLSESARLARALDRQQPPPGNNPQLAAAKRDLLYLADMLARAEAEVRAQYHALNGRPDILERA